MIDRRKLLGLDEPRLLQQQLQLVIDNTRGTAWVTLLLIVLVRLTLAPTADTAMLNLWCVAQFIITANLFRMVHLHDRWAPLTDAQAQRLTGQLFVGSLFGALNCGLLVLAIPAGAGAVPLATVYALVAALQSGAVSTMGSVRALPLTFLLASSAAVTMSVGVGSLVEHPGIAFVGALYLATLLDQAMRAARVTSTTIQLRFENAELLESVQTERAAAVRVSAAKSHVLAAASHDLRQPVHAQGLFLELLGATSLTEHQRGLLTRASEAVGASSAMLGTLFDYSRIEAGVIEPQREAFAIQPMLNRIEREFGPQADAKWLTYRSRESALVLYSDPALVELILRNLIANAIRYTHHGGLLVTCRQRGAQDALLEVWDTGIGIAPEHQGEVFREFYQLDNPERDRHKGFGLGLAIVDGLARSLRLEVSLRSTHGRGSVFRVRLPRASAADLPARARTSAVQPRLMLAAHLLVIDDDETILAGMAGLLQSWGCTCDTATTIEGALALAAQRAPDLLITDYRLREQRTGLQAIAELHAALSPRIPAVLITGDTAPDRLREAAERGITLLHKPVLPGLLYRALVDALANQEGSPGQAEPDPAIRPQAS